MAKDPEILAHQEWLGYVQPVGLVVSIPALHQAQAYVNKNIAADHQRFLDCLPTDEDAAPVVTDFPKFTQHVLGWQPTDLVGGPGADPVPDSLRVPLTAYGETLEPTYAVSDPAPKDPAHSWMLLVVALPTDQPFDKEPPDDDRQWKTTPQARFERLLRETQVPAGLLFNGTQFRLVYAPRGENSGHITFGVADMATVAGRPIFAALHMLLCAERLFVLPDKQRLPAILLESRKYQNTVSTQLAEQVLAALYDLLRGFQAADGHRDGDLLRQALAADPNQVYSGLLTVLMRLVFILYAEDRGLLSTDPVYANFYSVTGLFDRLRADHGRYPDTMDHRYGAWAQLLTLFRLVYDGGSHGSFKIPARRGYLFDPDRYRFLEGRQRDQHYEPGQSLQVPRVADGVIFRVLSNLLILDGERLSYRTLDVEQIGSVYETMMGFDLEVATGPSIAIKPAKSHGAPACINLEDLLAIKPVDRGKVFKDLTDQKLTSSAADALKSAVTVDDLLAAVESKIARNATPNVVRGGAMLLQPSDARRRSGSHYTPRSLTEPIVRKTFEPILLRLTGTGVAPTPEQLLDLKICDPAVGSGAFLVEACRQLGDELVKSWHAHGRKVAIPADEDETLHARRLVAQRCLYGVDRNPMAVDLAKLSLWLVTLAKDHPFTFIDHNLRCGDSLVGLTRKQIDEFHWKPDKQMALGQQYIQDRIRDATAHRKRILDSDDALPFEIKQAELNQADGSLDGVRFFGDLIIAAFFGGEKDKQRIENRNGLLARITEYLRTMNLTLRPTDALKALSNGPQAIKPFHWEIEFPEVFGRDNGGFDAMVGNPPFLGGTRISEVQGMPYFQWLITAFPPAEHHCDLVAYFFRKCFAMLRTPAFTGLIATNTIAQGDTREGGLRQILAEGGRIYSAITRYRWPGSAAVLVSVIHVQKSGAVTAASLDGCPVSRISAFLLEGDADDSPRRLTRNPYFSLGSKIYGQGFVFADGDLTCTPLAEMHQIVEKDPRCAARFLPYIGGDEVNSNPTHAHNRYVICTSDLNSEMQVAEWPLIEQILRKKVKPERDLLGSNPNNIPLKKKWWAFQAHRPELCAALNGRHHALCISRVGQYLGFAFLPTGIIYSEQLVVIALDSTSGFAALQCRVHEAWVQLVASSLEDRLRYTPSDCFETFPFPKGFEDDRILEAAGRCYYEFRAALMIQNNEGLTKTYNRFHDPNERSAEIAKLRELHGAMDRAVLNAYGWTDIQPKCEFLLDYEEEEDDTEPTARTRKKPWRYRWPDEVRDDVLARLLELNKTRAEAEKLAGAAHTTESKPVKAVAKKSRAVPAIDAPLFAYPATEVDKLICAASLAAVEQVTGLSSMDHLNMVLFATHREWCKEFLEPTETRLLEKAVAKAPAKMQVGKNESIRWKDCRDYLEHINAIRVNRGTPEQFIETTAETSTVKAKLPGGVEAVVAFATKATKALAEVSKDAAKASSQQKEILNVFLQVAVQMGLVAA